MKKAPFLMITTLLAAPPLAVSADNLESPVLAAQPLALAVSADRLDGPMELDEHGLDAVTAGSGVSVPPSVAVQALSEAAGAFVFTNTRTTATVQGVTVPLGYGSLLDWLNISGGMSMATAFGDGATTSTAVVAPPEAALSQAINPFTNTINYTRKLLNSEISVFAQYSPNGPLLDYTTWQWDRMNTWGTVK